MQGKMAYSLNINTSLRVAQLLRFRKLLTHFAKWGHVESFYRLVGRLLIGLCDENLKVYEKWYLAK